MTKSTEFPDFHDRVVLITGGTSGIGLATARLLLERGAQVIVTGRDDARLDRAAQQLDASSSEGKRLLTVRADVADLSDQALITYVAQPGNTSHDALRMLLSWSAATAKDAQNS